MRYFLLSLLFLTLIAPLSAESDYLLELARAEREKLEEFYKEQRLLIIDKYDAAIRQQVLMENHKKAREIRIEKESFIELYPRHRETEFKLPPVRSRVHLNCDRISDIKINFQVREPVEIKDGWLVLDKGAYLESKSKMVGSFRIRFEGKISDLHIFLAGTEIVLNRKELGRDYEVFEIEKVGNVILLKVTKTRLVIKRMTVHPDLEGEPFTFKMLDTSGFFRDNRIDYISMEASYTDSF